MDHSFEIGPYAHAFEAALSEWSAANGTARLWARDATLWTGGDEDRWLGWLEGADEALTAGGEWARAAVSSEGCSDIVLLGMGGSSLCPEVISRTFQAVGPRLHVLDSTVPGQVLRLEQDIDLPRTLFIVASKSGTTAEVSAFCSYFLDRCRGEVGEGAGSQFMAITDPGSPLQQLAEAEGFGSVFLGEPTIGGRFSALSPFGLVPAAAYGLDVDRLLSHASQMATRCRPETADGDNPGVALGLLLGELARSGRDKLTFLSTPGIASLGGWLEQLLAESTGKNGTGVIPVDGEPPGDPAAYGDDRVFVFLGLAEESDAELEGLSRSLQEVGHPIITIRMPDQHHLWAEFFRWEVATAVAGWRLGIHPFDQPNVQESKDFTNRLTEGYEREGRLPEESPLFVDSDTGASVFAEGDNARLLKGCQTVREALACHLGRLQPGDYVAFCAFIDMSPENDRVLRSLRGRLRDRTRAPTTLGFGPRFLHSTGQLHKGGPDSGLFIQVTADDSVDAAIPGKSMSFGVLKSAQAMGDYLALNARNRRLIRIHLKSETGSELEHLASALV